MSKLKLSTVQDHKPVKLTLELPAALYRDLALYADLLTRQTGQKIERPQTLITPMLDAFLESDRLFMKIKRNPQAGKE